MSDDASDLRRPTPLTLVLAWVARLLAAGILSFAGYLKLSGHQAEVELFEKIGMEPTGRVLIGSLELLAALLLLIPQSVLHGAFLGLGIMFGAIIGHLTQIGLPGIQWALLVAVACITVLYLRRYDAVFIRNLWDR